MPNFNKGTSVIPWQKLQKTVQSSPDHIRKTIKDFFQREKKEGLRQDLNLTKIAEILYKRKESSLGDEVNN